MKQKRLYRSRTDRVLFGVCGGLGKYFGIDPVIFRILFVLFFFIDGAGLIAYLIMILIIPNEKGIEKDDKEKGEVDEFAEKIEKSAGEFANKVETGEFIPGGKSANYLGIFIIFIGLFFLARETFPLQWLFRSDIILPFAIILLGLYIVLKSKK
ncbi:PspC domain-containing protein [Candidatus Parcubacteria bacterium]|nr:PspC domain-containing protein [Candidatus Parcubacteria bacterium]